MSVEHLEIVTDVAARWKKASDEHTRMELLLELRERAGIERERELWGLLLSIRDAEHQRANDEAAKAERKFLEWRDRNKPDNWAGDKRHLLKK